MPLEADNTGYKLDNDKPRWELVPPEITALVELYTAGAKKYGDRNWEKGMSWGRVFSALMRHAWKWFWGEEYDEETGAHHMVAVAWNAITLYVYTVRKVGIDDRNIRKGTPQSTSQVQTVEAKTPTFRDQSSQESWRATASTPLRDNRRIDVV